MTPRLIAWALALLLLVTQQLGLQHLLSHGLQSAGLAAMSTSAHPAHVDASAADAAADGLCQACLALVVLGAATLPAMLRWATLVLRAATPVPPVARVVRRGAGAPYLARGPPLPA